TPSPSLPPDPTPEPPSPTSADDSAPVAPDLHRSEKATLLMVAAIAAIAALLGAAVGGTATLFAAHMQATAQADTTRMQAAAQADTETTKFVRDERTKLYAEVLEKLQASSAVRTQISVEMNLLPATSGALDAPTVLAWCELFVKAQSDLSALLSRVHLLGSQSMKGKFFEMTQAHAAALNKMLTLLEGLNRQSDVDALGQMKQLKAMLLDLSTPDTAVILAARADIGIPEK
ncbi:hypothetical protein ACFWF3_28930, partial [Nocardia sp. NPDC060220]|uniref:hypothetical protein n=1 Tax=Nocardia sp. NPDC060220 TaxID=3347076 RepID=UPI00364CE20F